MKTRESRVFESRFDTKNRQITGHGAVFNLETELWPGHFEKVDPGFFNDVLDNDVRALFNHDSSLILARTKSGTLKLSVDATGLKYVIPNMPNTTTGNDLLELIKRGDISQSSFSFITKSDKWSTRKDGTKLRTLLKCEKLYDVSPVTFPAYDTADVAVKSCPGTKNARSFKENDRIRRIKLILLNH